MRDSDELASMSVEPLIGLSRAGRPGISSLIDVDAVIEEVAGSRRKTFAVPIAV